MREEQFHRAHSVQRNLLQVASKRTPSMRPSVRLFAELPSVSRDRAYALQQTSSITPSKRNPCSLPLESPSPVDRIAVARIGECPNALGGVEEVAGSKAVVEKMFKWRKGKVNERSGEGGGPRSTRRGENEGRGVEEQSATVGERARGSALNSLPRSSNTHLQRPSTSFPILVAHGDGRGEEPRRRSFHDGAGADARCES